MFTESFEEINMIHTLSKSKTSPYSHTICQEHVFSSNNNLEIEVSKFKIELLSYVKNKCCAQMIHN